MNELRIVNMHTVVEKRCPHTHSRAEHFPCDPALPATSQVQLSCAMGHATTVDSPVASDSVAMGYVARALDCASIDSEHLADNSPPALISLPPAHSTSNDFILMHNTVNSFDVAQVPSSALVNSAKRPLCEFGTVDVHDPTAIALNKSSQRLHEVILQDPAIAMYWPQYADSDHRVSHAPTPKLDASSSPSSSSSYIVPNPTSPPVWLRGFKLTIPPQFDDPEADIIEEEYEPIVNNVATIVASACPLTGMYRPSKRSRFKIDCVDAFGTDNSSPCMHSTNNAISDGSHSARERD